MRMFSWFAGFAPAAKPEIAVSVMLANDLRWREKANEVARDFLAAYFDREVASRSGGGAERRARAR
jgi:cell division protein FtsI/penicillin-binding protein 2